MTVVCNKTSMAGRKAGHMWIRFGLHRIMGYSTNSLPHIGKVPGEKGQSIIAGFTGHAIPQAWLSDKRIAAMISKGIPRIVETTQARLEKDRNDILEVAIEVDKSSDDCDIA